MDATSIPNVSAQQNQNQNQRNSNNQSQSRFNTSLSASSLPSMISQANSFHEGQKLNNSFQKLIAGVGPTAGMNSNNNQYECLSDSEN